MKLVLVLVLAFSAATAAAGEGIPVPKPRPVPSVEIVDVVDGDTIRVEPARETPTCSRLRYGKWESIRILGLDTPEMRGSCPSESRRARAAKSRLEELLASGRVTILRRGCDRYERTLGEVLVDGRSVAETLIEEGLARPYSGGHRDGWCTP